MPTISVRVDPALRADLDKLKRHSRFASISDIVRAALDITVRRAVTQHNSPNDMASEIKSMFDDLAHSEPQPDGTVPVRHNNYRNAR